MKRTITLQIDSALHGRKIEYVLEKHIGFSSTLVKRLKRTEGSVVLNGKNAHVIDKVQVDDELIITIYSKEQGNIIPVNAPIEILYEDEDILAVNKPRSMPTHPSRNHQTDTLANAVLYHLKDNNVFHAITRLDRDTSGVVLIAKNAAAAAFLTEDIKNKNINKEYIAIVNGKPVQNCGTISAPIKRKEGGSVARCVSPDGKQSITEYEVEKTAGNLSLVRLYPVTGRTHQLRVHMSYIGTPIYGDSMYGAPQKEKKTHLHCHRISFCHPMTKGKITVTAQIPVDIADLIEYL